MWEASRPVSERNVAIEAPLAQPMVKPLYLLDGQQRLTSLHRAYSAHPEAIVVFNVETQAFQIQSAATAKDVRWVRAHTVINNKEDTYDIVDRLRERVELAPRAIHDRLEQLRRINDYSYYLEILEDLPYEQVTEIFIRVNSRGRPLKTTDLALATLSARWRGTVNRVEQQVERCASMGYRAIDATFHTRCLAAFVSESASPKDFSTRASTRWKTAGRGYSVGWSIS